MSDVLAALQARFVARCAGDLARLRALVAAGDLQTEEARALAHSLAGAGATFGFPQVSAAAGRLDDSYAEGRPPLEEDATALLAALEAAATPAS